MTYIIVSSNQSPDSILERSSEAEQNPVKVEVEISKFSSPAMRTQTWERKSLRSSKEKITENIGKL